MSEAYFYFEFPCNEFMLSFTVAQFFETPWAIAHHGPLPMELPK